MSKELKLGLVIEPDVWPADIGLLRSEEVPPVSFAELRAECELDTSEPLLWPSSVQLVRYTPPEPLNEWRDIQEYTNI